MGGGKTFAVGGRKKWVGERVHKVGDGVGVGVQKKDYTIKMHLTIE